MSGWKPSLWDSHIAFLALLSSVLAARLGLAKPEKAGARCISYSLQECVNSNLLAAIFGNSDRHSNESIVMLCGRKSPL